MVAHSIDDTWQSRAACKGPDAGVFFPPPVGERREARDQRERQAKAICAMCSVRRQCLEFALSTRESHGVWGGYSEIERRTMLTARTEIAGD